MRTNIDIDDELMRETMKVTGATTKKAAVEEAMRRTVRAQRFKELLERTRGMGWKATSATSGVIRCSPRMKPFRPEE